MVSDEEKLDKTIILSDGRQFGYIERGNPEDKAVFYLHGWPSSRLELLECESFTSFSGSRIISIDRPGIGLSDFKKKRTILDLVDDIVELADFLGIEKFSVLGLSGGAPFAHACAYKIPDRLNSVGIVAGMGPYHITKEHLSGPVGFMLSLLRVAPWLMRLFLGIVFVRSLKSKNQEKAKDKMRTSLMSNSPEPDQELLKKPEVFAVTWRQMQEAFTKGAKGPTKDGSLYTKHWGFELNDIPKEVKIFLWHGEMDNTAPVGIGKAIAKEIPHCVSKFYPKEGHSSLLANNFDEIINTLLNA